MEQYIPSAWDQDIISSDELREKYCDDMQVFKNVNIPEKKRNIFRILTYNIHYWTDPYGKDVRHDDITKIITRISPDVFGLQEVLIPGDGETDSYSSDNWSIKNTLKPFERAGYTIFSKKLNSAMSKRKTGFGNVLGYRQSMSTMSSITFQDPKEKRGAVIGEFEPFPGCHLVIANTHLDVYDNTGETRRMQITTLMNHLHDYYPNTPKMIIGDFNCLRRNDYEEDVRTWLESNSPSIDYDTVKLIEKNGYTDLFVDKDLKYTVWSGRRVDYMFVKDFPYTVSATYALYSDASDHIPLIVDITNS